MGQVQDYSQEVASEGVGMCFVFCVLCAFVVLVCIILHTYIRAARMHLGMMSVCTAYDCLRVNVFCNWACTDCT